MLRFSMIERQSDPFEAITLLMTTFPSQEVAETIATELVESQLAACVNLLAPGQSIFQWKGKIEKTEEVVALIKTTHARMDALSEELVSLHPYDEPELLCLGVHGGTQSYLNWVREAVD